MNTMMHRFALLRWDAKARVTWFIRWISADSAPHAMVLAFRTKLPGDPGMYFARSETGPANYLQVPRLQNPEDALDSQPSVGLMTPMSPPPEVTALLSKLIGDYNRDLNAKEAERAKADPRKYKLTRVLDKPMSYHYEPAGLDGLGRSVSFCWTLHRNVAGYFLGWREVAGKHKTKRDQWIARRVKRRARELAERRAEAFRAKHQKATEEAPSNS